MYVNLCGCNYYIDEKSLAERLTPEVMEGPPWRTEEIIEIQKRMTTLDDMLRDHMLATATPDPIDRLRKHLDEMLTTKEEK